MKEAAFTPIHFATWPRCEVFYYFSGVAPTAYSMTVELDVTRFRKTLKEGQIRFFPVYLWAVTTCLNHQTEFKIAEKDGILGFYDYLTPLYAQFHEDTKTFSLTWTPYEERVLDYCFAYEENREAYGNNHGLLAHPDRVPPPNAYTVSAVPWVDFTHFAVHNLDNKAYYFPSIEAGKITEKDGREQMPLSLTCHHATTDGWHIKCFLEELQHLMDHMEEQLS